MVLLRAFEPVPSPLQGGVAALGNFDGFHKGHQTVVSHAARLSKSLNAPLLVVTFDPHPARFFNTSCPPFALMTLERRAALLTEFGADGVIVLPFNAQMAQLSPEAFVTDILAGYLHLRGVVSGYDFTFGKGRAGTTQTLQQLGAEHIMAVEIVPAVHCDSAAVVSSSLIRQKLAEGKPLMAAQLLGRWWTIEGVIERGDQRGRLLGFPTANISLGNYTRPKYGVYAIRALLPDGRHVEGVANVGLRPTFDPPRELLEAHLFNFSEDLYGKALAFELVEFIRPERKFDGLDSLKAQITADIDAAKKILGDPAYAPAQFNS